MIGGHLDGWNEAYEAAFNQKPSHEVLAHISPDRLKDDRFAAVDTLKAVRALGRLTAEEAYHWHVDDTGCDLIRGDAPTDEEVFPANQVRS